MSKLMIIDESSSSTQTGSTNQAILDAFGPVSSKTTSSHGSTSFNNSFRSHGSNSNTEFSNHETDADSVITFCGVTAGIISKFFEKDLLELAEGYDCQITKEPSIGNPKMVTIKHPKEKFTSEINKRCKELQGKTDSDFTKEQLDITEGQITDVKEFINDNLNNQKTLFYFERFSGYLHVVGRSYEDIRQGMHQLKLKLGIIKTTSRTKNSYADIAKKGSDSNNDQSRLYPDLGSSLVEHSSSSNSSSKRRSAQASSGPHQCFLEESLNDTLMFKVYKGSILRLDVDVIVNAANDSLMHGGGVAKVIADAAGYELEQECRNYIWKGKIRVRESFISTAGRLDYEGVIHSVGPQWHMYSDKIKCLEDLYWTVWNILDVCDKKRYKTVAMPAISAGIYGVPKQVCADMYVKAAVEYSRLKRHYPKEFHIVDVDEEILRLVTESYKRWIEDPEELKPANSLSAYRKHHPVSQWNHNNGQGNRHRHGGRTDRNFGSSESNSSQWSSSQGHGQGHGKDQGQGKRRNRILSSPEDKDDGNSIASKGNVGESCIETLSNSHIVPGITADVYKINSKIKVKVYQGSLEKVSNIDALVSSVDRDGNPAGIVANILKKAGGHKYTQDIEKSSKSYNFQKLNKGDVFISKAGQLEALSVIHVYLPRLSSQDDLPLFQNAMKNVLLKAEEKKLSSIAMPMLGTGGLQHDDRLLKMFASDLVSTICKVSFISSCLSEVHLVNKSQKVLQALNSAFLNSSQNLSKDGTSSMKGRPLPNLPLRQNTDTTEHMDTDDDYARIGAHKRPLPAVPHDNNSFEDDDGNYSKPFNGENQQTEEGFVLVKAGSKSARSSGSMSANNFTEYRDPGKHYGSDEEGEGESGTSPYSQSWKGSKPGNLNIIDES